MSTDTKGMMKWPLIIAAVLLVLRIVLEQAGAPEVVNNVFGISWLYFIVPLFFAYRISASSQERPFKTLFKKLVIFAAYTRVMILPTYMLAYRLQWQAPRFGIDGGGVVGEDVSPLTGYLGIPIRNALIWIVIATAVGMILGSVTLLIRRRKLASTQAT